MAEMIVTKSCLMCGGVSQIKVDGDAYRAWKNGKLIQHAFPSLTAAERELIQTGIHDTCWQKLALPDDEEEGS